MQEIRIGILHAHNSLNYGAMMMCENAIHYLSNSLPKVHFLLLSDYIAESEDRLRKATGQSNIEVRQRTVMRDFVTRIPNRLSFALGQVLFRYRNIAKALGDCNAIMVLGGDDISEYYGLLRLLDILFRLKYLLKRGKKVYLLGQSIGPMRSWRIPLTRIVLSKVNKIYHRGPRSHDFATKTLKLTHNSFLSADLAFLDLPRQNDSTELPDLNVNRKGYITFVPSGIWSKYSDDYLTYVQGLLTITRLLIRECKKRHMVLVLLPHVLRASDDRTIIDEIVQKLGNEYIVPVNDVLLPYQARAILGQSYFVVTQRMHGAISSFQTGVPSLSISYSVKYSDVIGHYLGLPELVVEVGKATFDRDIQKVCAAITFTLKDLGILKVKVRAAAYKAKQTAELQIREVAEDLLY